MLADPTTPSTPDDHADDLHRVIEAVGGGPVDLFASSGGAVNALALVSRTPRATSGRSSRTSRRSPSVLPDREHALAAATAPSTTPTMRRGWGAGMAHFIAVVSHEGEFPADFAEQPAPDPAMFGMPTEDDGTRTDPLLAQTIVSSHPLRARLRRAARRTDPRSSWLPAPSRRRDGQPRRPCASPSGSAPMPVRFPSDHGGFLGGEYGQTGEPEAFAAKLREVLDAS